jgi:multiple sugar transport system substrate-binding protein
MNERTVMSANQISRRRFLISTAAAASSAWFLAACSSDGGSAPAAPPSPSTVPQSEIEKALDTETTLTFWTWVPDIQNEIKLFTTKYPKVKVNLVNVGQGAPHYQKLRTAIQAGQGAPDVAQVEFQYINSFTLGEGDLLDLTPYVPATLTDSYPGWVWSQVNTNGGLWGIPQDTGPMGLLYRDDLLTQAGVEAPKTWDDFAAAAQTYHSKNAKSYLVNVAPNEPGQFVAYLWQAGVRPFTFDGQQTVKVDLANAEAQKVAKFWGDMVTSGTASNDADFNDTWYQGLSNGKYATLPIAAWGPVFLQGTAGKTSGKWRANDLPQWDPSKVVSSNWGGSTDAVLKLSKNQIAASQLALFINTNKESALKFANEQYLFPAMKEILTDPSFVNQESKFYGGQKVNEKFAQISDTVSPDFQWLPFMDFVYSKFNETLGKAFADKTDAVAGLQAWQDACAKFAKDQGFTVS